MMMTQMMAGRYPSECKPCQQPALRAAAGTRVALIFIIALHPQSAMSDCRVVCAACMVVRTFISVEL
jgi:hypothetical protein